LTATVSDQSIQVHAQSIELEKELDALFAPPEEVELLNVRMDWSMRDTSPQHVQVELEEAYDLSGARSTLRILSHDVGGVRHFGAILVPHGAPPASLPILVFAHGGERGVELERWAPLLALAMGNLRNQFVIVFPSFRDEPLIYKDREWKSDGPPSPWDYDVDDTISLVNVTLDLIPESAPDRYLVVGASRGAGVALLMGIRDDRIMGIISFFGPTDFMNDWARDLARNILKGGVVNLPGVGYLRTEYVVPWWLGDRSLDEARLALIRRSAGFYAEDLPALQIHHGDMDEVVSVTQAESMIEAMSALGRGGLDFEAFIYPGGAHDLFSLQNSIPNAIDFIERLLDAPWITLSDD